MGRSFFFALALASGSTLLLALPAESASVSRSYSYFNISGRTLAEIEKQLERRGPKLNGTGKRHPGATRMEFNTRLGYGDRRGRCAVVEAQVTVKATVILPRWRQRGAESDVRFIWETIAADIKRHEEEHVDIAKDYARRLERELKAVRPGRTCEQTAARAKEVNDRLLASHDAAQDDFDRVENRNFESRILRLMEQRFEGAAN